MEGSLGSALMGLPSPGGDKPVTPSTLFQAASISKPVTAAGALILVQDDSIGLNEEIEQRLKSWQVPENELTQGSGITLRGLLSHTGGFVGNDGVGGYEPGALIPTITQALNGELSECVGFCSNVLRCMPSGRRTGPAKHTQEIALDVR